jgi:hypothetical protein
VNPEAGPAVDNHVSAVRAPTVPAPQSGDVPGSEAWGRTSVPGSRSGKRYFAGPNSIEGARNVAGSLFSPAL